LQACTISNGDLFRWEDMWPKLADYVDICDSARDTGVVGLYSCGACPNGSVLCVAVSEAAVGSVTRPIAENGAHRES
jgi:hypothetical protein